MKYNEKKYEVVIGLEVHAQLHTQSKMFCACSTNFGDAPNSNICPICAGLPGTLPTINKEAVNLAIKVGLALNCEIKNKSAFARKNYFYPDLTKGYQITQFEYPICVNGHLDDVSISRIQIEEDAGKSLHDQSKTSSLIDYNRCGVPLIEIISGPDIKSPSLAIQYLKKLRNILRYLDACEGNMQRGNFRCDSNVSIRLRGEKKLGTRTEVKNLNSFKSVEASIEHEIERQIKIIEGGGIVTQETLLWNDARGITEPMRGKEEAQDYRYFPEPDLLTLEIESSVINKIKNDLPELPDTKAKRFVDSFGIPEYDAKVLTSDKGLSHFYEEALNHYNSPKKISNWIMTELLRELKSSDLEIESCRIKPSHLANLVEMIDTGTISGKIGKEVFIEMFKSGDDPKKIIESKNLTQVSDSAELERVADEVIKNFSQQVEQYKKGKTALLGFFVGQMMKETKGQANPSLANEIFKRKLS